MAASTKRPPGSGTGPATRAERSAEQLRANLKRRKDQAKARSEADSKDEASPRSAGASDRD